jgi:probable F420-dependent oxidoreductase
LAEESIAMHFGLTLPLGRIEPKGEFQSAAAVREMALAVERAGVAGACLSEHPAPDAEWLHNDPAAHDALDPLTALAFVAAATTRLKVFTNVLILPFRNPFLTAKAAATLQVLSDSRLILGVGVGYQKAEFEALGAPFHERGALTDEALETIRLAWRGGAVVKQGRHFNAVGNEPRPAPSPAPPIWVGGASDKAVERAASLGDGWIPYFSVPTRDATVMRSAVVSMEHFAEKATRLTELRDRLGRTGPFDIAPRSPLTPKRMDRSEADQFLEAAAKLRSHGASWTWTVLPAPSRPAFLENVAWYGEEVIARFKTA